MIKREIIVGRKYWCGDGVDRQAILCRVVAIADDGAVVRRSWGNHGLIGFDKVLAEYRWRLLGIDTVQHTTTVDKAVN